MARRSRIFFALAWTLLALPGLLTLAPADWPVIAWVRGLLATAPLVDANRREPPGVEWSWSAWQQRSLQQSLTLQMDAALVGRPLIVRATNQLLYDLFRRSFSVESQIRIGPRERTLHGFYYLQGWCSSLPADADAVRESLESLLVSVNRKLGARGAALVFVITPNKLSVLHDDLPTTICRHDPGHEAQRERLVADLVSAGVRVIDGVALTRRYTRQDPVPAFPRGGVHWSRLVQSRVAQRLLAVLSAEVREPLGWLSLGPVDWQAAPTGSDADYALLLNLLEPPLDYPVGQAAQRCHAWPAGQARDLVLVGSSFMGGVIESYVACQNFRSVVFMNGYSYWVSRMSGPRGFAAPKEKVADLPALWAELLPGRPLVVVELHEKWLNDRNYVWRALTDLSEVLDR